MSSEDERYDLLIGFLEGELDDDERELVDEELAGPGDARDRLEAYRGLGAALAELEPPAPSAEARDRAYAAVLAAMAEANSAPAEAPAETSATPAPATAPRGQILRFMSALAAAALIMVSAVFYLDGLESPSSKVASAPKKIALERPAPLAQRAEDAKAAPQEAAPRPESAGFAEESELPEAEFPEPEADAAELPSEDRAKLEERLRKELARERQALGKNLEGGAAGPGEAMRTTAQAPSQSPAASGRTPAPEPAKPEVRQGQAPQPETPQPESPQPESKAFGQLRRDAERTNDRAATPADAADAPEATADDEPAETVRARRKQGPGGQRGAKRKETRAAPAREVAGEPKPSPVQLDSDGTQPRAREGGRPQADSGSGGGGGGGGARGRAAPQGGGEANDMQAKKAKTKGLAGKTRPREQGDGKPSDRPTAGRRDKDGSEDGFQGEEPQRFGRMRAETAPLNAKELQPAWIVTRGRERVLYVMEGSALTQAPFPDLPLAELELRSKAKQNAGPRVDPLQVTALAVQRRALSTKRKSVDLRVLERREDLLAIAQLELDSEIKTRAQGNALGGTGRPGAAAPGAPPGKKETGKKETGKKETGKEETGKAGQQEPQPNDPPAQAETEDDPAPGAQAEGKRPLPAPAAGRDRAELLLRLLGEIEARRPSRAELQRALRRAERRHAESRR